MIYDIIIFIAIIFLISTITWLVWHYYVVAPPLQPQYNAEIEINNATLSTWPTLTYDEAKSRDPRTINAICCSICLVDYEEEEGKDKALRLLPECGHLFHATCVDPWLWQQQTCPMCRSLAVNRDIQTSLAESWDMGTLNSLWLLTRKSVTGALFGISVSDRYVTVSPVRGNSMHPTFASSSTTFPRYLKGDTFRPSGYSWKKTIKEFCSQV